jgi:hypothetical protein
MTEYRRFVFLAMEAGHPVTPSEQVDQAWHLHLLYTRSYWDDLCGQVLGRPLHHGPTQGGPAEGAKFHDWYRATLDSYERIFGRRPPADIWPEPAARFRHADRFRRINTAEHVVISKGALRQGALSPVGLVAAAVVATGCAAAASTGGAALLAQSRSAVDVIFFIVVGLPLFLGPVLWMVFGLAKDDSGSDGDGSGDTGCGGGGCGGCGGCGG